LQLRGDSSSTSREMPPVSQNTPGRNKADLKQGTREDTSESLEIKHHKDEVLGGRFPGMSAEGSGFSEPSASHDVELHRAHQGCDGNNLADKARARTRRDSSIATFAFPMEDRQLCCDGSSTLREIPPVAQTKRVRSDPEASNSSRTSRRHSRAVSLPAPVDITGQNLDAHMDNTLLRVTPRVFESSTHKFKQGLNCTKSVPSTTAAKETVQSNMVPTWTTITSSLAAGFSSPLRLVPQLSCSSKQTAKVPCTW